MRLRTTWVPVTLLLCSLAPAQYTVGPAASSYTPITGAPGAVQLMTVSNCDDCVETINISFAFPWFGQNLTSLNVSSNGAIIMDGWTGSMCCSAWALDDGQAGGSPVLLTPRARISIAQEDLDPEGFNVWMLDTGVSVIVSFEGVPFFPGPSSGSVEAQAELFVTGDVEIRFGNMVSVGNNIATGLTDPHSGTGATVWFSPNSVLPQYNAVGQTTGGVVPQNTGVLFAPITNPPFQINSPEADIDIQGSQGSPFAPAVATACVGQNVIFNANSSLGSNGFEIALDTGAAVPAYFTTANGQVLNIDLATATFLNGGAAVLYSPFSPITALVPSPVPAIRSAQMAVVNPAHPDGVSLSQPVQLDAVVGGPAGTQSGPTGDDSFLQVFFSGPPLCGPASVPFCGTSYTNLYIISNGRVMFGGSDTAYNPTVSDALVDNPFFGHWSDYTPGAGGTIDYTVTGTSVTVNYNNLAYYSEPTSASNFALAIDASGTVTIDVAGVVPNPLSNTFFSAGDAIFLGLSCGQGTATDPGITTFSAGGSGANVLSTDMIYDYADATGLGGTGGLLPSVTSLQTGTGLLTFTPGGSPGDYLWVGL